MSPPKRVSASRLRSLARTPERRRWHFLIGPPPYRREAQRRESTRVRQRSKLLIGLPSDINRDRPPPCAAPYPLLRSTRRVGCVGRKGGGPWQRRAAPRRSSTTTRRRSASRIWRRSSPTTATTP